MAKMTDHYETLLADHYSWLFGGLEVKCAENKRFFNSKDIKPIANGQAIDLGCGSGFQSIPLAQIGFSVTSIDLSPKLLAELSRNKGDLLITTINDDLNNFYLHCPENVELIVCMGDTLTHLETKENVTQLFEDVYNHLEKEGRFILTYRDLSFELKDLERFIPVNSNDTKICTCFLEYGEEKVKVHDLIYEKENNAWSFKKSYYRKLRLSADWVVNQLTENGFQTKHMSGDKGLTTIIATKSSQCL
jgi:SAM-dependent methyltransferase